MVDRRRFLKGAGFMAAAGCVPPRLLAHDMHAMKPVAAGQVGNDLCMHAMGDTTKMPGLVDPAKLTPFVDALPLPPVRRPAAGDTLHVRMARSSQKLHRDLPPTELWTYDGHYPGPTIEARTGTPFDVVWENALPTTHFLPVDHAICGAEEDKPQVRAIVHLHGAKVPHADDGYPEDWYVPGTSRRHRYPNAQDAATLWYHDHAMGINRLNMYAGLMGLYLLRDEHELSLGLPSGEFELPLVFADRLLRADGRLYYPDSGDAKAPWVPEVFGNLTLVNGAILPRADVQPRRYRLRVLNAANGRFYHLRFRDGRPFQVIGSDQGLLAAPTTMRSIFLAPGERADIVVDFAASKGTAVELMNDALPLMRFAVGSGQVRDDSRVPEVLRELPRFTESSASKARELTLDEYSDCVATPMLMLLNGKRWHDPVTETVKLGSTETWSLVNLTEDTHPIHLHLVRFQILDRRPYDVDEYMEKKTVRYVGPAQVPPPHERGWKDVVQAYPGMVTRIVATFDGYAGRYAWHCHLAEHEANEMMRPLEVVA
ncbi:multicopper oxidase domain-containing protein [Luteibacter aegosomatis]|uniref:multicopper oxidase family protein n=1 Tax=Luteibacter aegosomatis TaxID=2911537 RepID=UPI001FF9DFAB|nr:multicopper oxidase domain-containing protein [Luteibacter aegosomatis]UPG86702.1 multicopper oxidase domain-containing protein [Luteibacter aegosomatis]